MPGLVPGKSHQTPPVPVALAAGGSVESGPLETGRPWSVWGRAALQNCLVAALSCSHGAPSSLVQCQVEIMSLRVALKHIFRVH